MPLTFLRTGAVIVDSYRYLLWRAWHSDDACICFLMLNPSTADESVDDPTLRRCVSFAQRWGYSSLVAANLFAYRSNSPQELRQVPDPIGALNNQYLVQAVQQSQRIVVAWGVHGRFLERDREVLTLLDGYKTSLYCFGRTQCGSPRHPLYLRKDTRLQPFAYSTLAN